MQTSALRRFFATDIAGRLAAAFLAAALLAVELFIPNRGSPEYTGLDLARYQTRGAYIPFRATEMFAHLEARSHWVYYALICMPLLLTSGVLFLSSLNAARSTETESRAFRRSLNAISGIVAIGTSVLLIWTLFTAKFPRISWTIAPPPILVVQAFGNYFQPAGSSSSLIVELVPCAARTSLSLLLAITIATALALTFGLALGHLRSLSAWISPYVYIISPLPPIVLFPVINALTLPNSVQQFIGTHIDDPDRWLVVTRDLALTGWAVFWPIFAAALDGSRLVNPRLLSVAQLLGAGPWRRLWKVVLPQSIGSILTNFRLGVIMGMIVLLFAQAKGGEPLNPKGLQGLLVPGLGGKLAHLDEEQNLAPMLACVVTVIAVVLIFDLGRLVIERLCFPWLHLKSDPRVSPEPIQVPRIGTSISEIADNLAKFLPEKVADPIIVVEKLKARFGSFTLDVPELKISKGQIVSLIGKSSSGKTSLVEVISGMDLHGVLSGSVRVNGQEVYDSAGFRNEHTNLGIGFVHQDYGLFAHLTVRKNLDFAIRLKRRMWNLDRKRESKKLEADMRTQLFAFLGLSSDIDILAKYPSQLSGGQRQRVAIARALLTAEPLLVLDEGLNSIDQPTRGIIRDGLCNLVHRLNLTLLAISHDNQDVLQISDRILYMERESAANASTIVADATPRDFYYTPASEEAARFIGHYNVFKVDSGSEHTANGTLLLNPTASNGELIKVAKDRIPLERKDDLLVIPASWVNPSWNLKDSTFTGVIRMESFAGPHHELTIECEGGFSLRAIVQDDDYVFLAEQESGERGDKIPRLKGRRVGLSIGHPIPTKTS